MVPLPMLAYITPPPSPFPSLLILSSPLLSSPLLFLVPQSHSISMSLLPFPLLFSVFFTLTLSIPDPDAATVQPISLHPSPPATIPAFPEQSAAVAGCPLHLSDDFFRAVKPACSSDLHRSRCCPVLAAWLYSAYSATSLKRPRTTTTSFDMPLLPDDSETCVSDLGKALKLKGVDLVRPNDTCDLVYCYCGIRLHPLSCPDAFSLNVDGQFVGDESVHLLERNCLTSTSNVDQLPGLGGCSNCLHTLYKLNKKTSNSSKSQDRTTKIHNKDCELMGLTWLLAKNRSAYIHTVSGVLRAFMLSSDGSDPKSCTLNSDGMPLAVDSSELYDSSSNNLLASIFLCFLFLCLLLLMQLSVLSN